MERTASNQKYVISDGKSTSYKVAHQPKWVENDVDDFLVTSNYDLMLKPDTKTQEELDKIEIRAETLISRGQLAVKFATDEIFYDVTKQIHFKLLKKVGKGTADSDEWVAVKMEKPGEEKKKKDEYNVKECNLR